MVQCTQPGDTDLRELRVYGEQRSGFTPSPDNMLATSQNALLSVTVPTNTQWWVRLAWVDQWGATDLNFSGEFEAEASQILETVIGPDSISTPMLKANAVTADKIAANTITGNEISSATTIIAGTGENTAGINGAEDTENAYLSRIRFWAGAGISNAESANYKVYSDGKMVARGADLEEGVLTAGRIESSNIKGGLVEGAKIHGGIIEGAVIISGGNILVSTTEADQGAGTVRYFYNKGQVFDVFANGSVLTAKLASFNYTGDGTEQYGEAGNQETAYANFNRFGTRKISFTVTVTAPNAGAGIRCNRANASWSVGHWNDSLLGVYGITKNNVSTQLTTFRVSDTSLITSYQTYNVSEWRRCCEGSGDSMYCKSHTLSGVGGRTVVLNINPFNYDGAAYNQIKLERISGNAGISNIKLEGQL